MNRQPVDTVSTVVLIVTIVANMGIALADFASAKFVLNNSAQVGVSTTWLPMLGALKAAGAVGLLLGLLGVRLIGIAAALGLVVFFIGAVATTCGPEFSKHRLSDGVSGPSGRVAGGVVVSQGQLATASTRRKAKNGRRRRRRRQRPRR